MSQEVFAREIQTTRRHLIRVEGGIHRPRGVLLERIAVRTEEPRESFTNEDDEEDDLAAELLHTLRALVREELRQQESSDPTTTGR